MCINTYNKHNFSVFFTLIVCFLSIRNYIMYLFLPNVFNVCFVNKNLTPNMYTPTRMFQLFVGNWNTNDFINISRNSPPFLQKILSSVSCTITSLSPVSDKFARHFQRVTLFQIKFLATSRTSASFVNRFSFRRRFIFFPVFLHRRIINWILYTIRTTLHRGLRLLNYHLFVLPEIINFSTRGHQVAR